MGEKVKFVLKLLVWVCSFAIIGVPAAACINSDQETNPIEIEYFMKEAIKILGNSCSGTDVFIIKRIASARDVTFSKEYSPLMLIYRDPMILWVKTEKWHGKINNLQEFLTYANSREVRYTNLIDDRSALLATKFLLQVLNISVKPVQFESIPREELGSAKSDFLVATSGAHRAPRFSTSAPWKPIVILGNTRLLSDVKLEATFPLGYIFDGLVPTVSELSSQIEAEYTAPYVLYKKVDLHDDLAEGAVSLLREMSIPKTMKYDFLSGARLKLYLENFATRANAIDSL